MTALRIGRRWHLVERVLTTWTHGRWLYRCGACDGPVYRDPIRDLWRHA